MISDVKLQFSFSQMVEFVNFETSTINIFLVIEKIFSFLLSLSNQFNNIWLCNNFHISDHNKSRIAEKDVLFRVNCFVVECELLWSVFSYQP